MTAVNDVTTPQTAPKDDAIQRLTEISKLGFRIKGLKAEIEKQQTEVSTTKSALDDEKQTLSDLQSELKELQDELDLLAQGGFSETFNFSDNAATAPTAEEQTADEPQATEPAEEDESWRFVKVADLQLPGADLKPLTEAELDTIGKLADYTKEHKLTDVKGIGEKRAERIEKALDGFWQRWAAAQESETTTPTEPAAEAAEAADAATNADTFAATYKVVTREALCLSEDELHSLTHPALASQILKGKVPNLSEVISHNGTTYVLVPAPVERVEAYAMRVLTPVDETLQTPDQVGIDGAIVKHNKQHYRIGGESEILLVSR